MKLYPWSKSIRHKVIIVDALCVNQEALFTTSQVLIMFCLEEKL